MRILSVSLMAPICFITFFLLLANVPAPAQDCPDYQDYLEWIPGATLSGWPRDVVVSGDHAYIAVEGLGLQVVSVVDPRNPEVVGTVDYLPTANIVVVVGNLAYLLTWDAGLHIFDVSSPETPSLLGSVMLVSWSWDVAISESYAYVGAESGAFSVIDVSDPTLPEVVGTLPTFGPLQGVAVAGNYILGAHDFLGLQVFDVEDPQNPFIAGSVEVPGSPRSLSVSGGFVYIAAMDSGLQIIDIADPVSPLLVGSVGTLDWAFDVEVSGSYAYVACGFSDRESPAGLMEVIDVSNAWSPFVEGTLLSPEPLSSVALTGDFALTNPGYYDSSTGNWVGMLAVAWIGCGPVSAAQTLPGEGWGLVLNQNIPNPFNPQTTIAIEIPSQQDVTLRVFDLSGRLVRNLIVGESHAPGRHEVVWNGRDDVGSQCASGTYFYRLEAGEFSETKRMVLVK